MKVVYHTAVSVPLAGAIYAVSESWQIALSMLIAGIFVDVDHFIDYVVEYGLDFDVHNFLSSFPEGRYRKIFIFLHGWEWVFLLAIAAFLTGWNQWVTGALIGLGQHMVFDQMCNGLGTWAYFFSWRAARRFTSAGLFGK